MYIFSSFPQLLDLKLFEQNIIFCNKAYIIHSMTEYINNQDSLEGGKY